MILFTPINRDRDDMIQPSRSQLASAYVKGAQSVSSANVLTAWCRKHSAVNGDRTNAAAGPRSLMDSLPVQLRNPDITYGLFRWQLKKHLFRKARTRRSVTFDIRHLRKTLIYLLISAISLLFWCDCGRVSTFHPTVCPLVIKQCIIISN